jgi:diguanylate cyclase (GGDEF)-like protein/PAS domain S-box-containing protein
MSGVKEENKTREPLSKPVTSLRRQIAELERTVELLQKERDTLFSILERAPYGVVLLDKDGKTLFTNTEFTAITGYTSEDVPTAKDWFHVAYPEKLYSDSANNKRDKDQRKTDSLFHKMIKRVFFRSFSVVSKDGTIKEIEFRPTELDDGSTMVMLADITELKRAEEAFQESEKQFRRLVQYIPDIFSVHDSDGNIIDVNQHACESLEYTREELLELSVHDIEGDFIAGKHAEQWKQMVPGVPILLEGVHKRKDGTTFPVEIRIGMFESGDKKLFLALTRDITERKRAEEALRESEERYRTLVNNLKFGITLIDTDNNIVMVNAEQSKLFNKPASEMIGKKCFREFEKRDEVCPHCPGIQTMATGQSAEAEAEGVRDDGSRIHARIQTFPAFRQDGTMTGFIEVIEDITERKQAEKALQASEGRYRSLVEFTEDPVYLIDREKRYLFINEKYLSRLGLPRDHVIGRHYGELHCREDNQEFSGYIEQVLATGRFVQYEHRSRSDGRYFLRTLSPVQEPDGRIEMVTVIAKDITERKQAENKLTHMATHDFLTGLPNRILFNDRLTMALAQAQRHQQKLCVMLLDLDYFKDVNDTLGHSVGDKLLRIVGERLTALLRTSDTVARMGGDEFLLLLTEIARVNNVTTIAQKILEAFRKPFVIEIDDHELMITTSIGIAIFPDDGDDADVLLKNVDIAMYRAKEKGRNNFQCYSSAPR